MDNSTQTVVAIHRDHGVRMQMVNLCRSVSLDVECFPDSGDYVSSRKFRDAGCLLLGMQLGFVEGVALQDWLLRRSVVIPTLYLADEDVDANVVAQRFRTGAVDVFIAPWRQQFVIERIHYALECQRALRELQQQAGELQSRVESLTRRQKQVFERLMKGMTGPEIARDLELEPKTIDRHRSGVLRRLDVPHTTHAIRFGMELRSKLLSAELLRRRLGEKESGAVPAAAIDNPHLTH